MGGLEFLPQGHPGLQLHGSVSTHPLPMNAQHFQLLECFTVILYDKTSNLESVNEVWRELFCQKNKTMEHIHTNSGFPAAALKVSGLPGWNLDDM